MSQSADDIYLEEIKLEREVDDITIQLRNVRKIEEEYDEFFHYLSSYSTELQEHYGQSSFGWYIEDQTQDLRMQQGAIFDSLAGDEEVLDKQRYDLENEREALIQARKKLLLEEEDMPNG